MERSAERKHGPSMVTPLLVIVLSQAEQGRWPGKAYEYYRAQPADPLASQWESTDGVVLDRLRLPRRMLSLLLASGEIVIFQKGGLWNRETNKQAADSANNN